MESAPTGRLDTPSVALVEPVALVPTTAEPSRMPPAENETDPVGPVPAAGVTTAVSCTGSPRRRPAGIELVTPVTVAVAGAPPTNPTSSAWE